MSPPSIDEVPYLWHCDGSLRDIYILETNLVDWERFLSLVRAFPATYTFDGEVSLLPSASEIFRNREGHHILSIRVGAASVNCHFFIVDEIELDVDPREITAQSDHHALLAFVRYVALGLQKQALLTPENGEDTPFLTFDPAQDSWYVRGQHGARSDWLVRVVAVIEFAGGQPLSSTLAPMPHKVTLTYTEPLLRQAVFAYWRRSVGIGFVVALAVVAVSLGVLLGQGETSWFIGVLVTVLALGITFVAALYFIHYRNSLRKFREMRSPHATFLADEFTFTISSGIGSSTLQWSAVKELWQFPDVWLLLYSKAQFSTLPLACLPPEFQAYLVQRVRAAGGKIGG